MACLRPEISCENICEAVDLNAAFVSMSLMASPHENAIRERSFLL